MASFPIVDKANDIIPVNYEFLIGEASDDIRLTVPKAMADR
jgi:hypothetical protein